jgi:hypothetical protein
MLRIKDSVNREKAITILTIYLKEESLINSSLNISQLYNELSHADDHD